jgi:ribose 5-phosphate isomerase A
MTPGPSTAAAGKASAAAAALSEVRSGLTLGLGTGSTMRYFLDGLAVALRDGGLTGIRGVPTSHDTETRARALGIPLVELHDAGRLDLAVDGADEFDPSLDLIKGLGGALLREKMVVQAADRFVVLVDPTKRVGRLGTRAPLPVEVVPFGWKAHIPFFREWGADPSLRMTAEGEPFLSDNGNLIVDLGFPGGIGNAGELDEALQRRAGIVESGLFLEVADRVLVGDADGVEVVDRKERP